MLNDRDVDAWTEAGAVIFTGALIGAAAAFMLRTDQGRRLYDAVVNALDEFAEEYPKFCQAAARAQSAAADTWNAFRSIDLKPPPPGNGETTTH